MTVLRSFFQRSRTTLAGAVLAAAVAAGPAQAASPLLPPSFDDWKLLVLPDKDPAEFKVSKDGALQVETTSH